MGGGTADRPVPRGTSSLRARSNPSRSAKWRCHMDIGAGRASVVGVRIGEGGLELRVPESRLHGAGGGFGTVSWSLGGDDEPQPPSPFAWPISGWLALADRIADDS